MAKTTTTRTEQHWKEGGAEKSIERVQKITLDSCFLFFYSLLSFRCTVRTSLLLLIRANVPLTNISTWKAFIYIECFSLLVIKLLTSTCTHTSAPAHVVYVYEKQKKRERKRWKFATKLLFINIRKKFQVNQWKGIKRTKRKLDKRGNMLCWRISNGRTAAKARRKKVNLIRLVPVLFVPSLFYITINGNIIYSNIYSRTQHILARTQVAALYYVSWVKLNSFFFGKLRGVCSVLGRLRYFHTLTGLCKCLDGKNLCKTKDYNEPNRYEEKTRWHIMFYSEWTNSNLPEGCIVDKASHKWIAIPVA